MPPIGIQTFYYGKKLPARAIAIAQVTAEDVSPADLIDIVNTHTCQVRWVFGR